VYTTSTPVIASTRGDINHASHGNTKQLETHEIVKLEATLSGYCPVTVKSIVKSVDVTVTLRADGCVISCAKPETQSIVSDCASALSTSRLETASHAGISM
jgi:hypothetical protein